MAQYGNMTLREREDKNKSRKGSQDSSDISLAKEGGRRGRKMNQLSKKVDKTYRAKYDGQGFEKDTGLDVCDCLVENCPGCWLDCPTCGSKKCGNECRVFRRYKYDYVEVEGSDGFVIKNKSK